MKKLILLIIALTFSLSSFASTPLVTSSWLSKHIDDDSIFLLDIRNKKYFNYVRIPSAVHSDYSQWRQPQSKILQKMLPSKAHLEALLSAVGVNNNSHIIIVSAGESVSDLAAASRVYWTLEQIGHEKKSILSGGIIKWAQSRFPLTQDKAPTAKPSNYKIASIKPQLNSTDVLKVIDQAQIIDTRSVAEFKGLIASPDERKGSLKNAKSLPYDWFSKNQSGQFQSLENIKIIADSIGYDNTKDSIVYCHTGHRAALSWFVLHELLGNDKVKLYDGSTRDWATQPKLPMTQAIHVK